MTTKKSANRIHNENAVNNDILDAILPEERKLWIFKQYKKLAAKRSDIMAEDVRDIAQELYLHLLSRKVSEIFPDGLPNNEAKWVGFLKKDVSLGQLRHYRNSWRHPESSLDLPAYETDEEGNKSEVSLLETFNFEEESMWIPNFKEAFFTTAEAKYELQYVKKVCDRIMEGCSSRTKLAIEQLIYNGEDVKKVSLLTGMKASALYTAKNRFIKAVKRDGQLVLGLAEFGIE